MDGISVRGYHDPFRGSLSSSNNQQRPMKSSDFYKGKVVNFRVGFGAGGGYDVTARLVSKYLGAHIPGKPSITVENMPGAGSMRLANYLYNVAPKDGTVFGTFSSASILEPIVGNPGAKFDPAKFTWLGSMHTDLNSCGIWKGGGVGIASFDDLVKAKKTITFGSSGPQSTSSLWPLFMKNVFNAPIKVIGGYKGIKAITLAMSRGEVDAVCGLFKSSLRSAYADDHKSGNLKIFLQVGLGEEGAIVRRCRTDYGDGEGQGRRNAENCSLRLWGERNDAPCGCAARYSRSSGRGSAKGVDGNHEGSRYSCGWKKDRCGLGPDAGRCRREEDRRDCGNTKRYRGTGTTSDKDPVTAALSV